MKNFFGFSKGEQRGIIVLLFLIVALVLLNIFIKNQPGNPTNSDEIVAWEREVLAFEKNKKEIAQRYDSIQLAKKSEKEAQYKSQYKKKVFEEKAKTVEPEYFVFDPNTATVNDFVKLGFSEKQAESIDKYRKTGVIFKENDDFSKVYVVSEEMYQQLKPWIYISNSYNSTKEKEAIVEATISKPFIILELNNCDTAQLKQIQGIGNVLSQRIVDYRNKIGGYYTKDQLLEINGITEENYPKISQHFTVDASHIKKLNINKITFKHLLQHPYFEYYIVKNIFTYKDKIGKFKSVEQLKEVPLIYEELYIKISPYITL